MNTFNGHVLDFLTMLSNLKAAGFKYSFLKEKNLFIRASMIKTPLCINKLPNRKSYRRIHCQSRPSI